MQTLIAHPNSPEQEKALLSFLESMNIDFETEEDFQLSDEQKIILDSQSNLERSKYQDNNLFIEELKKEYGL